MTCIFEGLGKPDFSTAGKLFYRLAPELRENLNRSEEKTLIWTIFLAWHTWFHGGRQSLYASYSEAWVGTKFGRSRWTVARAVATLSDWGLITVIHRRPRNGDQWQTNLYHFGGRLLAALAGRGAKNADTSPCSRSAPQEFEKKEYKRDDSSLTVVVSQNRGEDGNTEVSYDRSQTWQAFFRRTHPALDP